MRGLFDHNIPRTSIPWAVPVIIAAVIAAMAVWGQVKPTSGQGADCVVVVYSLGGTASRGDVTMTTRDGGTSQEAGVSTAAFVRSFCAAPGSFVYLSVQNAGDSGSVSCQIKAGGEVVAANTSTGAYQIASCQGTA